MRKFLILVSIAITLSHCKQKCNYVDDYYPLIYRATLAHESNDHETAVGLYQEAFAICSALNTPTYNELIAYAKSLNSEKQFDQAIGIIQMGLEHGILLRSYETPEFVYLFSTSDGKKLKSDYNSIRKVYLGSINLDLRNQIQDMLKLDQQYRILGDTQKSDSVDAIHLKTLFDIIEKHGYPNEDLIGHNSVDFNPTSFKTLLLHTPDSFRVNYLIPKLTEFVKVGTCPPLVLAHITDQYLLFGGKQQIYGTVRSYEERYPMLIEDLDQVNTNRVAIGLPYLEVQEAIDSIREQNDQ
jgi:hypothetical protein